MQGFGWLKKMTEVIGCAHNYKPIRGKMKKQCIICGNIVRLKKYSNKQVIKHGLRFPCVYTKNFISEWNSSSSQDIGMIWLLLLPITYFGMMILALLQKFEDYRFMRIAFKKEQ